MIQSGWCLLTIMMRWMHHSTRWTQFADYILWWDGWTMIQSERCLPTGTMGWMDHDIKWTMFADYWGGMDAPRYKMNAVCWLHIVMGWMDHDITWTMFADCYDGVDGPWYKVNDVCWLLGWDGWTMAQIERCSLTIMMGWMGRDTKWSMFADYYLWWDVWAMIQSERCLLTIMMRGMVHDTKLTIFSGYYHDGMDGPWFNVNDVCWLRRSTIEVHSTFSEAPHLRNSIPHPKTDFSKKQIASWWIIPWPQVYKNVSVRNKNGIATSLG